MLDILQYSWTRLLFNVTCERILDILFLWTKNPGGVARVFFMMRSCSSSSSTTVAQIFKESYILLNVNTSSETFNKTRLGGGGERLLLKLNNNKPVTVFSPTWIHCCVEKTSGVTVATWHFTSEQPWVEAQTPDKRPEGIKKANREKKLPTTVWTVLKSNRWRSPPVKLGDKAAKQQTFFTRLAVYRPIPSWTFDDFRENMSGTYMPNIVISRKRFRQWQLVGYQVCQRKWMIIVSLNSEQIVFLRGDVQVELLSLALQESRAAPLIGPKFVTRSYLSLCCSVQSGCSHCAHTANTWTAAALHDCSNSQCIVLNLWIIYPHKNIIKNIKTFTWELFEIFIYTLWASTFYVNF